MKFIYYCSIFIILFFWQIKASMAMPNSEEILGIVGIQNEQITKLNDGEPVSQEIGEGNDKELALIVAIYLKAPLQSVIGFIKNNDLSAMHTDIISHGKIPNNANMETFKAFNFTEDQMAEALDLMNAEPGDQFNLSLDEINELSKIRVNQNNIEPPVLLKSISEIYRKILYNRWRQYKDYGMDGISYYSRVNERVQPGVELKGAVQSCKVLSDLFSDLFNGLINYPNHLPSGTEESYYWINRLLEDRPTAVLGHRVFQETPSGAIVVDRQFYVSHSYNTTHEILGALPYLNGTLIFHAERTSTDQVSGAGSFIRHNLGRKFLKAELVQRLLKFKQSVEH